MHLPVAQEIGPKKDHDKYFSSCHTSIMVFHYAQILDKLLDKTLAPNLNAKSAFTVDSVTNSNSYGSTYAYR